MSGYECEHRNVLRRCLKTASDGAAVTWAGRSFHTAAPDAVNVRLSTDRVTVGPVFCSVVDNCVYVVNGAVGAGANPRFWVELAEIGH